MNVIAFKRKTISLSVLVIVALVTLMPISIVFASELGGYVSEKLIWSSGTSNSQLVLGNFNTNNSSFDIGTQSDYNPVTIPTNTNIGYVALNTIIPLVLMAMFIVYLLAMMVTSKRFGVFEIIIVAVLIYVFYAFLPTIQAIITSITGE
jgi:hypothetical protein